MCNRLLVSVRVHPEERCGGGELYETRQIRIYGGETVEFRRDKVVFKNADRLKWASGAAGIAVMAVAQAYGIPPQALAVAGVEEAKVYTSCMSAFDTDASSLASQARQSVAESGDVQGAVGKLGPMGCLKKIWNYIPKDWKTKFQANSCAAERLASVGIGSGGSTPGGGLSPGPSAEELAIRKDELELQKQKHLDMIKERQARLQFEKQKFEQKQQQQKYEFDQTLQEEARQFDDEMDLQREEADNAYRLGHTELVNERVDHVLDNQAAIAAQGTLGRQGARDAMTGLIVQPAAPRRMTREELQRMQAGN